MDSGKIINPYSLPVTFRNYIYSDVVLAFETKRVIINSSNFNSKVISRDCGLDVLMISTLAEVHLRECDTWSKDEFLYFLKGESGYSCLLKRLRDTFAHGHFGSSASGWITIRHRYKGRGEKKENTRAFGILRIATLKKLIKFLDQSHDQNI